MSRHTDFDIRAPWVILIYSDVRGRSSVREWLAELRQRSPDEHAQVRHHVRLLEREGVLLKEPYCRQLSGKLRELRPGDWRITYFADPKRRMILLTNFRKRGRRTDPREIRKAEMRMYDWLARLEEAP